MRTKTTLVIVALFVASLTYAASVHLKGGAKAEPEFFDLGLALQSSAELAGLGNGDVLIQLDATADVTATCGNPGRNRHQPPGRNPAPISVTGTQSIPASEVRNGNLDFQVTTIAVSEIEGAPDCPSSRWIELVEQLDFTSATITVEQGGEVVLVVECVIDPASSDGVIDAADVICD